jgi:hypothetical protein
MHGRCCTGEVVQFTIAGTNIGNLRIGSLSLVVSGAPVMPSTLDCTVEGQNSTLAALSQVTIEPQQSGSCAGTYIITTADIMAGDSNLTATVTGSSAMGRVDASRTVLMSPAIRRTLTAAVAVDLCSNATAAGMCTAALVIGTAADCGQLAVWLSDLIPDNQS